jgi:predicted nucleic acid-binding protein
MRCAFCCTRFVLYECLQKPRKSESESDSELKRRLKEAMATGQFRAHHISVEDLQELSALESRKRISKGELSSILFAIQTRQAFLTDDQAARALAENIADGSRSSDDAPPIRMAVLHSHSGRRR